MMNKRSLKKRRAHVKKLTKKYRNITKILGKKFKKIKYRTNYSQDHKMLRYSDVEIDPKDHILGCENLKTHRGYLGLTDKPRLKR